MPNDAKNFSIFVKNVTIFTKIVKNVQIFHKIVNIFARNVKILVKISQEFFF